MGKTLSFGIGNTTLSISFERPEELKSALVDLEEIRQIIKENFGNSHVGEKKLVRKDLEGSFQYDSDGKLVMTKFPDSKVKKVALALYPYGGSGLTNKEITDLCGVANPSHSVLHDHKYRKYFRKVGKGKYALSDIGMTFVVKNILGENKEESTNAPS